MSMENTTPYGVKTQSIKTALGASVPDYVVPTIEGLVAKVVQRLEQMIASGAPDSETGDVVDPIIAAWVSGQRAALAVARTYHAKDADELVIHANAFVTRATQRVKASADRLEKAQDHLDDLQAISDGLHARQRGAL
jgi:hypothetical protein